VASHAAIAMGTFTDCSGTAIAVFRYKRAANGIASKIKQDPKKPLGFQVRLFGDFALNDDLKSFQGTKNFPIGIR